MKAQSASRTVSFTDVSALAKTSGNWLRRGSVTIFAGVLVFLFLMPLLYMVDLAFLHPGQLGQPGAPVYPAVPATAVYQGQTYPIYDVPLPDGTTKSLIIIDARRESSTVVDPNSPNAQPFEWQGRWRTLTQSWSFNLDFQNFVDVWNQLNFPRLFFNSLAIGLLSTLAALSSAILVAYGFARFNFPGKNVMFIVLLATIILPFQVTLIPQYIVFTRLGWQGTWLPLIVPHLFSNAFNVFLLRQYFMSIPRDLDEAAMMDGASPFRVLRSVILPLSVPAIVAVSLFHFFFSWNDFFTPLLYLSNVPELQTLPIALQRFNALYVSLPTVIQAAALMTMVLPVVVFFLAQGAFMRTVVITGVEK